MHIFGKKLKKESIPASVRICNTTKKVRTSQTISSMLSSVISVTKPSSTWSIVWHWVKMNNTFSFRNEYMQTKKS